MDELLIRIDENVKAIKQSLDTYPLPQLNQQIKDNTEKINNHVDKHWTFWVAAAAPALLAVILVAIEMFKGK